MFNEILIEYTVACNDRLIELLHNEHKSYDSVYKAMNYSVRNGGKRLRPAIVLSFCKLLTGDYKSALDSACSLEMIHTYSLIHDDLPCMDDDDLRRGKPSCHIKFDEATALLAGDGLLTEAFSVAASSKLDNDKKSEIIKVLADSAGTTGMIGGQIIDLESENKQIDVKALTELCELKTGKLIEAAAQIGCICGNANETEKKAALDYAYNLGLAFQVYDDILDITGNEAMLGKPIGSDEEKGKSTFVSLLGLKGANDLAFNYISKAKESLKSFKGDTTFLLRLADFCIDREK